MVPNQLAPTGYRDNTQTSGDVYTLDLGLRAALPIVSGLTAATAIGGQFNKTVTNITAATADNLAPGCQSVLCTTGTALGSESTVETSVSGRMSKKP